MDIEEYRALAHDLFLEAYEYQMEGDLDVAVELYQNSIRAYPTAEAHTFLGWAYSFLGRLDEAIAECKKAIEIDPDFGNPYNDVGMYLIEKSLHEEAIPWFHKAIGSKRYESAHFAHYNLGRVYMVLELYNQARGEFESALELKPDFKLAKEAILQVKKNIQ